MAVLLDQQNAMVGGRTRPINLAEGGQNGAMMAPHQWVSAGGYSKQKLIPVLLAAPGLMRYMDNYEANVATLKALMEVLPVSIDGLKSTINFEYNDTPVGNAGEKMHTPTQATRDVSEPNYRWPDKYGAAIQRFWTEFGRLLIMDPDLGVPGIVANQRYIDAGSPEILPHQQAMVMMYLEPDPTLRNVTHAWMCANMMPRTGGDIEGKREMQGANDVPEVSIAFTALTMTGRSVVEQAKAYLQSLNLANLRPTELKPFVTGISPELEAALSGPAGFKGKIDDSVMSSF